MVTPIKTKTVPKLSDEDECVFHKQQDNCVKLFEQWGKEEQVNFVTELLGRMCHDQHGQVNLYLKPMLQRDFITALPGNYLKGICDDNKISLCVEVNAMLSCQMSHASVRHVSH